MALTAIGASGASVGKQPAKPNVLFIAVDDLNDWASTMGGYRGKIHTPNIERLASMGITFTNAHCTAPSSAPSRAAVMTGVHTATSGMFDNGQQWREIPRLAQAITIPEYFRQHGYRVTGGGKIFHALSWFRQQDAAGNISDGDNDPKCWDEYYPNLLRCMPDELYPPVMTEVADRPLKWFNWGPLDDNRLDSMADHRTVNWAIGELVKKHEKPFFQAVGLFRPHIPWYVPQLFYDLYPKDEVLLPIVRADDLADARTHNRVHWHKWVLDNGFWKDCIQGYLASITYMDYELGRLLDALEASEYAKNTIIVLWSDNGLQLGQKENWEKFTLWEGSTRVAFMLAAPGVTIPGSVHPHPVSLLDIYPTLNSLCGFAQRDDIEGKDLMPVLKNPMLNTKRAVVCTNFFQNHAVRSDRYRYIIYSDGFEELYDRSIDPYEFNNLVFTAEGKAKYAPVVAEMKQWLPTINTPRPRQTKRSILVE